MGWGDADVILDICEAHKRIVNRQATRHAPPMSPSSVPQASFISGKPAPNHPNQLWDEYKLLQDKIDKIGEYQFKVKGWSASLLGLALFGGVAYSRLAAALVSGLAVAAVFHISESRQRLLSKRLQRRAISIEHAMRAIPPIADLALWRRVRRRNAAMRFVPAIARAITDESGDAADAGRFWHWLVTHSNDVFYWAQYALLVVLLCAHLIGSHFSVVGWPGDPDPRYQFSIGPYRIMIYRHSK